MKKIISIFLLSLLIFSCGKQSKENRENALQAEYLLISQVPVDTLKLTLDALRDKKLPDDYILLGDVKTGILTFTDYRWEDLDFYIFNNSNGKEVVFHANDTNFELIIPKKHKKTERILPSEVHQTRIDENIPNPLYLNKKFQVVWRTIRLDRKPKNETEYYYQEYDEIIYLKEITNL